MNAPDTPFPLDAAINAAADRVEPRVVAWRRDFHQNPELGNREVRTSGIVAKHLRELGFDDVREKVAHTGVVGVLKGGLPGPVVALRADMPLKCARWCSSGRTGSSGSSATGARCCRSRASG